MSNCAGMAGRAAAHISRPNERARWPGRAWLLISTLVPASCLLIGSTATQARAAEKSCDRFLETEQAPRLVRLWHDMLDHSSDLIYSPTVFQALAGDLEAAEADLSALREDGVLSVSCADCLRRLFHARYRHIREWHYTTRSAIRLSGPEAYRNTAHWVVEMQLSLLCRPPTCEAERELAKAAVANVAYQLTFLHHLDQFEAESDRRRMALRDKADAGGDVDLEAFEEEYLGKRSLLLAAYRQKSLPRVRSVEEVMPYVLALTRAKPTVGGTAREAARQDH